jgi:hypothetical protein
MFCMKPGNSSFFVFDIELLLCVPPIQPSPASIFASKKPWPVIPVLASTVAICLAV